MRLKLRLKNSVYLLAGFVGLELAGLLFASVGVVAIQLGNTSPYPENSNPTGGHVFLLRISDTQGVQRNIRLAAYYNSQPDGSFIKLFPGAGLGDDHVCSVSQEALSDSIRRQYLTVTLQNDSNGQERVYHIPKSGACSRDDSRENGQGENSGNVLYAKYQVPNFASGAKDAQTNMYKVNIIISLNDGIPPPDPGQGIGHRLIVNASDGNAKISQLGGNDRSFPIVGDWNNRDDWRTEIKVPFGRPCNSTTEGYERVGVYDADNGPSFGFDPRNVRYQVYEDTPGGWSKVDLSAPEGYGSSLPEWRVTQEDSALPGNAQNNVDTYVIPDGAAKDVKLASTRFYMKKDTQYLLYVYDLAPRNTIDIQLPTPSIFGTLSCGWKIKPETFVNMEYIRVGQTATWTHSAVNTGSFNSDNVTASVSWTTGAPANGSLPALGSQPRVYGAGNPPVFYNGGRMTAMAGDLGRTFCQRLKVVPGAQSDATARTSEACVQVVPDPLPPDRTVTLTPVVPDNPNDIEPTEFTTLSGYVNVSGFPNIGDYGYTEYSKQGTAAREPVSSYGWLETDTETTPPDSSTTYSCTHPNDYNRVGSTCYHDYVSYTTKAGCERAGHEWNGSLGSGCRDTHPAASTTTYSCPSGYAQSGSGASTTCTRKRYRCNGSSTWGAWNAAPPTCTVQYTCDSGAAMDISTNPPKCNAWKCPYQANYIPGTSTAPTCEFRCLGGAGNVAYNGAGWYSSPCYQPPSFTVTCKWVDNGFTWSETATSNGPVCNDPPQNQITKQAGVVVGSNVCATLTHTYPYGGWSPSSPSPGYGRDPVTGGYRQLQRWGWAPLAPGSATGCTRVVGKPTVKINGGDIVAGAAITQSNGTCNPVATANIVGWPHDPVYDASYGQLGVFAKSTITGFASAKIGSNQSQPPRGLSFANYPALTGQNYGGNFGNMKCIPDHYGNPTGLPSVPLTSIGNSTYEGTYVGTGGQINTSPIAKGQHLTVYVNGNVYITGTGIRYQERGAWVTSDQIPAFKLVVRGNIYIDPSVQQLDGIYVAQPSATGVGGNIYTCATSSAPYTNTNLYNNCRANQLVVNGAFIAKKVHLLRTQGTAIFGQTAEQFNYLPELWTAQWPATSNSSADELKYDSILSLPPVL